MIEPAFRGYFADPFVLRTGRTYVAYGGSGRAATGPRVFETLSSTDLVSWESIGLALQCVDPALGSDYWAPEVIDLDGAYWMYYSVGHGIDGHHVRVARSESPQGPFIDQNVNLTPRESFAIDPHPFLDRDGCLYLYFARDVLDAPRPGTHLAVMEMGSPVESCGDVVPVLAPNADWQLYERARVIHGGRYDWHTLEGPSVVHRANTYWMTYSGGAWTGDDYAVSWAVADHPLGPWTHAPAGSVPLLSTSDDFRGPGHNSLTTSPQGLDVIAFHSWDAAQTSRQMHLRYISFGPEGPRVDGPIRGPSARP